MGNTSSGSISINLDRNNFIYFNNEIITGNVYLNIKEGILKGDEIYICLTGEIGYTTRRTIGNGNGQSSAPIEYHHISFYSKKYLFIQANNGEKEFLLNQGEYSWPFHIPLLNSLPPTLNDPHVYPHVRYRLQVVIEKSWYKPNTKETIYVRIYPYVNLLEDFNCLSSTRFANENRKDIFLKGLINKSGFVPNETIHITLDIDNPREVLIKQIDLLLFQFYQIKDDTSKNILFRTIVPNILNRKDQQIHEIFSVLIPSKFIPPTFQFQGGFQKRVFVNIYYFLRFEVKVSGLFANFNIDLPIRIGTKPEFEFNQISINDNIDDDDSPPSYESVIQNLQ